MHSEPALRLGLVRLIVSLMALVGVAWGEHSEAHAQSSGSGAQNESPAQPPQRLPRERVVFARGTCPNADDVWSEIVRLVADEHLGVFRPPARIEIQDLGSSYRLDVAGASRSGSKIFSDPARSCDRRARFSAVFAVLTLMPPELGLGALGAQSNSESGRNAGSSDTRDRGSLQGTEGSAATQAGGTDASAALSSQGPEDDQLGRDGTAANTALRAIQMELGATLQYWPELLDAPALASYGLELRAAVGPWPIAPLAFAGMFPKRGFELNGIEASISREVFGLGGRWREDFGDLRLGIDATAIAEFKQVEGQNLAAPRRESALTLGARGEANLTYAAWRVAPFAGLSAALFPEPNELVARPAGSLGSTPYLEVSLILGTSLTL